MISTIALAQCGSTAHIQDNLALAERMIQKAQKGKASLVVFPEYFMISYQAPNHAYVTEAQPLCGAFAQEMARLAAAYSVWCLFGMSEQIPSINDKCYNTLVLLDGTGQLVTCYRKQHLFDAFSFRESADTMAGDSVFEPIDTPFGKLGLGICFDLRFPEVARVQAKKGAELMIYPAGWFKGPMKDVHWQTLLQARAIENGMYVLGCSQYTEDTYLGRSCAFDPMGRLLTIGGEQEELLILSVDTDLVSETRALIPSL